jgi:uncharacterized protein
VAEVAHQDTWQRATLAGAVVSGSMTTLQESCDRVSNFLDSRFPDGVRVERTLTSFEDVEGLA